MDECSKCGLPETFPGVRLDDDGICNYCRNCKDSKELELEKAKYRERFGELVASFRGKQMYDALVCYSGGKDSTYTLVKLRQEHSLRVLAVTLDNGFIPDRTFQNIRNVVERLGVDHLLFKPDFTLLQNVFRRCAEETVYPPKTLERASAICTACMALVKFSSLRTALDRAIPMVVYGWSPGQAPLTSAILKNNPDMIRLMQHAVAEPLLRIVGPNVRPYFLEERYFSGSYMFPFYINPLAFYDYNEADIYRAILPLGWEAPKETDSNSTNCLLNSFSIRCHRAKYGFHPYAFEIAGLVRKGVMTKEEGRTKLTRLEDDAVVAQVGARLGMRQARSDDAITRACL